MTDLSTQTKGIIISDRWEIITINGDEVVKDHQTGLMWERGNSMGILWTQTESYIANLRTGGFSDWRMPTVDELITLFVGRPEGTKTPPFYKGSGEDGFYWEKGVWKRKGEIFRSLWSSTEVSGNPFFEWCVNFGTGRVYWRNRVGSKPGLKCVR